MLTRRGRQGVLASSRVQGEFVSPPSPRGKNRDVTLEKIRGTILEGGVIF